MPREIVHTGRKIRVALDTSVGPNGETIRRDLIHHPGAVVILPVLDRDHICLLRNFRFVIGETLWEVPAGTLEPGELVAKAAERELLEETGSAAWRASAPSTRPRGPRRAHAPVRGRESTRAGLSEVDEQLGAGDRAVGRRPENVFRRLDPRPEDDCGHSVVGAARDHLNDRGCGCAVAWAQVERLSPPVNDTSSNTPVARMSSARCRTFFPRSGGWRLRDSDVRRGGRALDTTRS